MAHLFLEKIPVLNPAENAQQQEDITAMKIEFKISSKVGKYCTFIWRGESSIFFGIVQSLVSKVCFNYKCRNVTQWICDPINFN